MASIRKLDMTSLSSADGGLVGVGGSSIRSSKANVEKSKTFREGRESQLVGSVHHGGRIPFSSVLYSDSTSVEDAKSIRQIELRRVINAAAGSHTEDFTLGKLQSKPLEICSAEDVKRVKGGLEENAQKSRERVGRYEEAVIRVDRYVLSKKRSRPDSTVYGRLPPQVSVQRPRASPLAAKGGHRAVSGNVDISPSPKEIDMAESGLINKRVRTSLTDARVEGRPGNLNLQRSPGGKDQEREIARPSSSSLISPSKGRERTPVASPGGWEKTKMKGRRSATIKPETSVLSVANGMIDGKREQKGHAQQYRHNGENRSRPSEGHAYRSGPVHGITSIQKAQSTSQVHGSGIRGGSKLELNGAVHPRQKEDRNCLDGTIGPRSISREDVAASPTVTTKAKGARAPRSNHLVASVHPFATSSRSSCLTDGQDMKSSQASFKSQIPSESVSRKRPEPSRSSSPPVASWGSSKKMARVTRRMNPPPSVAVISREEANGVAEVATLSRDGNRAGSSPTPRSLPSTTAGSNLAKRTAASSTQSHLQIKVGNDLPTGSHAPLNSEDSVGDGQKFKEVKKKEERRSDGIESGPSQKMANLSATDKNKKVFLKEQMGGVDLTRRQERTGRGSVTLGLLSLSSPTKKVEDAPLHSKFTKSARPIVDTKPVGPGRPITKKGTDLRKSLTKPRRVVGNGLGKMSGGDKDDSEHLMKAVQQAVGFSVAACSNDLWRQLEPYFAYVTSDDLSFLHEQVDGSQGSSTNKQTQFSDTGSKSLSMTSGITETDGAALTSCLNSEDLSRVSSEFRTDKRGASCDKIIPLSHRLMSAVIDLNETDDFQQGFNETSHNRDFNSGLLSGGCNGSIHENRDPEGESACDNIRTDFERWSFGTTARPFGENYSSLVGQHDRLSGDSQGQSVWSDRHDVCEKDTQSNLSELSDWEEQYRQMNIEDRLLMELQSFGVFPDQTPDCSVGEEDELTRLQRQLIEEVCLNKDRISSLEIAVLAKRNAEDRAREQLAMNLLVDMAYKKRMGGRCIKGAAAKGARAAALMFAKRVLAKVQRFDSGHSCLSGSLQNLLFRVVPDVEAPTSVVTAEIENEACVLGAIADQAFSYPDPLSKTAVGNSPSRECEGAERNSLDGLSFYKNVDNDKSGSWPSRAKDRGVFGGLNSLSINDLGRPKGKCNERADQCIETRVMGVAKEKRKVVKSSIGNLKGERKTKTRPRQKTGSIKSAKGSRDRSSSSDFILREKIPVAREEVGQTLEATQESHNDCEGRIDLSALALPGIEDMNPATFGGDHDYSSFLDFEDQLQQVPGAPGDDFLQGLDCPMDDLTGLAMML